MAKQKKQAKQTKLDLKTGAAGGTAVECLGLKFPSEQARRDHFLARLKEKLADPEFRKTPGFPLAADEDILRLSDPPWYTACPNPFLSGFVASYGRPYDPKEDYHREPFAIDVSVGKTDALYKAHGYHTKVPHLAIVPSILHYTNPGDIVLDGFAGTGMTGVAAQYCGTASPAYRSQLEQEWKSAGHGKPTWGARRAVLSDLGSAPAFISANYNAPFNVAAFAEAAQRLLDDAHDTIGWMYETRHSDGTMSGRINYTVWSEVFGCPECGSEIVFTEAALVATKGQTSDTLACPRGHGGLKKSELAPLVETVVDAATKAPRVRQRMRPVLINYTVGESTFEKPPDSADLALIERCHRAPFPPHAPLLAFPFDDMWEAPRLRGKGITHIHHLFLPRNLMALATLWGEVAKEGDTRLRNALLFFLEQAILGMSLLARYAPTHYSQVNQYLTGAYYVGSQIVEASPWYVLENKRRNLVRVFSTPVTLAGHAAVSTGDCARSPLPDRSVDYIFTDPPFGDNYPYAELNLAVEAWHHVITNPLTEAIVDRSKANVAVQKGVNEYLGLLRGCFAEYARVLKPGRWITVVFSNSRSTIWRAIQEAIGTAGLVVADVRTLDKQQRSFKQVTSTAVKQDLIISAYKPTEALAAQFTLGASTAEGAWAFVREHLGNVPLFVPSGDAAETVAERTGQMLLDRMIAFHVQRGLAVPIDASDFLEGLRSRFQERDDMYFLPEQIGEYDKRRTTVKELRQLSLFVHDEASSIQWLRQQLQGHPQSYQELHPLFLKAVQDDAWEKHEVMIDLKQVLEQSFLCYDGDGPVPSQIHSYLSSNYKSLRNKGKEDPALVAEATDRWYVPDGAKQADREKQRHKALLKEFEEYRLPSARKLKQFRTESVRAGFKAAWDAGDYATIVRVGERLPEDVLQEDEKLLMYYDVARSRMGDD